MAKPKSQLFQRNQSPCRHSIMNQTNSLDFPGLPLMYLTNHCTSDSCHSRTHWFLANYRSQICEPCSIFKTILQLQPNSTWLSETTVKNVPILTKAKKNVRPVLNSRKPRGHKILKLNLSSLSHMIQGGPPAYQWTWPYSIMTLLRLICHQTDESEDPEITSGQPNPTTHPSLVFARHPHVPMYKSWSPQPLLIIPKRSCDRVNGDLSDSIFVWSVRN